MKTALKWLLCIVGLALALKILIELPTFTIFLATLGLFIWLCSRIVRFFPKRSIENWSGHGVATDLTPGEAGILIRARPGLIAAGALLWLEHTGRVRLHDEVRPRVEWIGPIPDSDLERAAAGKLESEADWRKFLEALYRWTNERMDRYSGPATTRHYRDFVEELWGDDLEESITQPGMAAWFALDLDGREWERIGDGPEAERVKRGVRIAGRLAASFFTYDYRCEVFAEPLSGFFRYRADLRPDSLREESDYNPLLPAWYCPRDSSSESEDENPDT